MKVLLINPKTVLPIEVRTSPPLGLAYLGAVSEQRGDEVRILDMEVEDIPLGRLLREERPDLVGDNHQHNPDKERLAGGAGDKRGDGGSHRSRRPPPYRPP